MELLNPVTRCLQCKYHSLTYSSLLDLHGCGDCSVEIQHMYIENTVVAFSVKKKKPNLITSFKKVFCVSCYRPGGVYFLLDKSQDHVYCEKCGFQLPVSYFVDAKVNAVKTKILEEVYNYQFSWKQKWSPM